MASDLIGAAQYQQFVKFATDAVSSTGSKTVAVLDAADPLGVRKISTQQHDRVGAFSRGADVKRDNDDVRAMFKSSVISLFGGSERDVPDVVLKALELKDYEKGKPLTARRILAVRDAIELAKSDPVCRSLGAKAASAKISRAIDFVGGGVTLSPADRKLAEATLRRVVAQTGLTERGVNVVAASIVRIVANPATKAKIDEFGDVMAANVARFRCFEPGDARLSDVDETLRQYTDGMAREYANMTKDFDGDGIYVSMIRDAPRQGCSIAGTDFPHTSGTDRSADILDAFKRVVPNPQHRKLLSVFMSQTSASIPTIMVGHAPLPPTEGFAAGVSLEGVKGTELFIPPLNTHITPSAPYVRLANPIAYQLAVSPDGRTATVTQNFKGPLRFGLMDAGPDEANEPIANCSWQQVVTFDLSGDIPRCVGFHMGHSFNA